MNVKMIRFSFALKLMKLILLPYSDWLQVLKGRQGLKVFLVSRAIMVQLASLAQRVRPAMLVKLGLRGKLGRSVYRGQMVAGEWLVVQG
jgi:hypothetical protein